MYKMNAPKYVYVITDTYNTPGKVLAIVATQKLADMFCNRHEYAAWEQFDVIKRYDDIAAGIN